MRPWQRPMPGRARSLTVRGVVAPRLVTASVRRAYRTDSQRPVGGGGGGPPGQGGGGGGRRGGRGGGWGVDGVHGGGEAAEAGAVAEQAEGWRCAGGGVGGE